MKGNMIDFQMNGQTCPAYLSPSKKGKGPGVIVIQEYWGLIDHIKEVADRFAEAGFTALAPDFYLGQKAEKPDDAGRLMMALNIDQAEKIVRGAVDTLLAQDSTIGNKLGVVGFCMGGQLSLYAASVNPKIGACVDYYGVHPNVTPKLENLQAPVLGFFAEHDAHVTPTVVQNLSEKLNSFGKKHNFITYPNANHAFFNETRPDVYNKHAAEDSWKKMMDFFNENL